MIQPNNLRNRWRRYRIARHAYGFTAAPFRSWARAACPESYSTVNGRDLYVPLIACRCGDSMFCTCYRPTKA